MKAKSFHKFKNIMAIFILISCLYGIAGVLEAVRNAGNKLKLFALCLYNIRRRVLLFFIRR
ncbi:MAG: hypothetical protein II917_05765, partial [Synergistaceae bacterium]|nr:hypothetical protein [Synergistaceae bacterium]